MVRVRNALSLGQSANGHMYLCLFDEDAVCGQWFRRASGNLVSTGMEIIVQP